jgi:site-specific recombinase XerD
MRTKNQAAPSAQLAFAWAPDAPAPALASAPVAVAPPTPPPGPPVPDPIEAYLERCKLKGFSAHTVRSYRTDLTKALAHCGPLLEATERQVEAFIQAETRRGLHPGTVGRRLNTLRSFYKDARRQRLLVDDPTLAVDPPKKPKRLPKYLKDHEVAAMMGALRSETRMDLREAAIVLTFYHTGMRLAEACRLNVGDVVGADVRVFGKGSKEREIPVNQQLRAALDAWLAVHPGGDALFCSLGDHPGRLSPEHVRETVKAVFKRAGLAAKRYTPHKLRHTFATRLINNGVRIDIIQRLLGHSGINTTMLYSHTEFGDGLRADLNRIL